MKTRHNTKPRNPFVPLSMCFKLSVHDKSVKEMRATSKRQLKNEWGNAQSMNNQGCC